MSEVSSGAATQVVGISAEVRRDFLNSVYQILSGLAIHDMKNAALQKPIQNFSKSLESFRQVLGGQPIQLQFVDGALAINHVKVSAHFSIVEAQRCISEAMEIGFIEAIRINAPASLEQCGEFFAKWALHLSVHRKPKAISGTFSNIELLFVDPNRLSQRVKSRELLMSPQYAMQRYFLLQESARAFFEGIAQDQVKAHSRVKRDLIELVEVGRTSPYNLLALCLLRPETGNPGMNIALGQAMGTCILSCLMAKELGFSFREQVSLGLIGLFYNVGLIGKEEMSVVLKSTSLTPMEYKKVLDAQASGVYKLIQVQGASRPVLERLLAIFEFSKGPQQGSVSLALESRLLKLVSQYIALTSERPFREPYLPNEAIRLLGSKLTSSPGGDLDPLLYYVLVRFLGVVPVGSLVMLNNQKKAVVFRPSGEQVGRPMVKTVVTSEGEESALLDLGIEKGLEISRILDPRREGVNVSGYFFD